MGHYRNISDMPLILVGTQGKMKSLFIYLFLSLKNGTKSIIVCMDYRCNQ